MFPLVGGLFGVLVGGYFREFFYIYLGICHFRRWIAGVWAASGINICVSGREGGAVVASSVRYRCVSWGGER